MGRKKKLTSKPENLIYKKTKQSDLTKEVDLQQKCSVEAKSNRPQSFANICHKKCYGANNWKTFTESIHNTKGSQTKNPSSAIKNLSNKKPTQTNQLLKHFSNKSSISLSETNVELNSSSLIKTFEDSGIRLNKQSFKCAKMKQGTNELASKKQSLINEPVLTKQVAMDCEMVGVEIGIDNNMLARISLVNALGDCIYDKFVKPTEPVLDYRTHVSGVRPEDLENAEDFKTVQEEVATILKGRVLVGHALKYDLKVLFLSHPKQAVRDTSKYKRFREGKTPSLKKLAKKYLGVTIQEGEHSSVQDALAAMQLYRMFKKEWESTLKKKFSNVKSKEKKQTISVL